ncbi:DNA endonuclease V [Synechococcus phage S-BM1]|nr:DNA endonuclease V [Synechococcus phage S-BM1]
MIDIIDDFLSPGDFGHLQKTMIGAFFPWTISKIVDDNDNNQQRNIQMVHMFYERLSPVDSSIELLYPVLQKVQPYALLKAKANFLVGTDKLVEHGMHIDVMDADDRPYLKTSILYMNTCNGYTLFEDGTKVESVRNRFVTFPNHTRHTGTTTTDADYRMVINFNYV